MVFFNDSVTDVTKRWGDGSGRGDLSFSWKGWVYEGVNTRMHKLLQPQGSGNLCTDSLSFMLRYFKNSYEVTACATLASVLGLEILHITETV